MSFAKPILVIKLSSLGDLFHPLPAVHLIRQQLGVEVDWVTQTEYAELVGCFEDVRRVIPFPRHGFPRGLVHFLQALRSETYSMVLDFQGLLKSAFVTLWALAELKIGPSYAREGARVFYDRVAGVRNKNRHAVEEALDFVKDLGLAIGELKFPARFPRRALNAPHPRIGLVPRSRWPTKNWGREKFAEVAIELRKKYDATIYVLGSAADREDGEYITRAVGPSCVNLCGQTSLVELGSVVQELDLMLTVDSGPMHMAAALGVPVVAVFGATDPVRTGPFGAQHRVIVEEGLECRPCLSKHCQRKDLACLRRISAQRVLEVVDRILPRTGPAGGPNVALA